MDKFMITLKVTITSVGFQFEKKDDGTSKVYWPHLETSGIFRDLAEYPKDLYLATKLECLFVISSQVIPFENQKVKRKTKNEQEKFR